MNGPIASRDRLTVGVLFAALLAVPLLFFDPSTTYISP
jgi:hypothetical protein